MSAEELLHSKYQLTTQADELYWTILKVGHKLKVEKLKQIVVIIADLRESIQEVNTLIEEEIKLQREQDELTYLTP